MRSEIIDKLGRKKSLPVNPFGTIKVNYCESLINETGIWTHALSRLEITLTADEHRRALGDATRQIPTASCWWEVAAYVCAYAPITGP